MKKTMVYLPDEVHEGLRQLAFDRRVSIAELIRRAVKAAYGEVLEDIRDAEGELASYLADRSSAMPLDEFLEQEGISVPHRRRLPRATRA